jgi:hypothetical protein
MLVGTCHFVSRQAMIDYYKTYDYDENDIDAILIEEINFIGPPKLKPGEKLIVIDNDCRYAIETKD